MERSPATVIVLAFNHDLTFGLMSTLAVGCEMSIAAPPPPMPEALVIPSPLGGDAARSDVSSVAFSVSWNWFEIEPVSRRSSSWLHGFGGDPHVGLWRREPAMK